MNFVMPTLDLSFYIAASPILVLGIGSLVSLMQSVFKSVSGQTAIQSVLYVSIGLALGCSIVNVDQDVGNYLGGALLRESLASFGSILILCVALATVALFSATLRVKEFFTGEIASLFQMLVMGMLVLVSAKEIISLFIGLELASIGLYAVMGYIYPTRRSIEGAVKYLILGSFATGFLLFGFALIYASAGSLNIDEIMKNMLQASEHPWMKLGALLIMVGLGFKLALVPFHLWAPDAYESAPTGLTAFMATSVKIMTIVVVLRFLNPGMIYLSEVWAPFFLFTAVLSTIAGNLLALVQSSIKRMLAYSSVAHAGYMAIALCAISGSGQHLPYSAILFYLVTYTIMSMGCFAIVMWLESDDSDNLQIDDLSGLAKSYPCSAFALAVFMFGFAGIPPTAGFMAKFFVFSSAISEGLYGLVVIGLIGAVISLYYYLRIIVKMYMFDPVPAASRLNHKSSNLVTGMVAGAIIMTVLVGTVLPGQVLGALRQISIAMLTSH